NSIPLPEGTRTIAHELSDAGYEVGYIGKWHLAGRKGYEAQWVPEERRGGYRDFWLGADLLEFSSSPYGGGYFDGDNNFCPFEGYRADSQTDDVLEYLRTRDGERPFFLFLSYLEPHHQNNLNRYVAPHGYAERYADYPVPQDLVQRHMGDWQTNLPDYYGICADLDENLGRIRAELERLGLAENTVIIYTTDHGTHFRTRNAEYKRSCHEASIRIPMVACGPGIPSGVVVDELVSLMDIPPTILSIAGAPVPEHYDGRNMLPLTDGTAQDWPDDVFVQISESQVGRAVRTARWKYGVNAPDKNGWNDMGSDSYEEQYLYDLEADPWEQTNLVGDPSLEGVRQELRQRLIARMLQAGEAAPEIVPAPVSRYAR
ncbi:MAG: sulfatase-like hydrolase/transferase, partial [Chloroflexi bacterium]|nr:sulfatase-like hydrolase/transferase [Chloroflexota bacterium]